MVQTLRSLMRLILAVAVAATLSQIPVVLAAAADDGLADRTSYEAWFGSLSGDARDGAEYWAGQRSLRSPGPCTSTPGVRRSNEWISGCAAAQERFVSIDARRKAEPAYRQGWNSWHVPGLDTSSAAPSSAMPQGEPRIPTPRTIPDAVAPPPIDPQWFAIANMDCPQVQSYYSASPLDALLNGVARAGQQQSNDCMQRKAQARSVVESWEKERDRRVAQVEADRRQAEAQRQRDEQLAAESSPDNICAVPSMAKKLMETFGELRNFKERGIEAIDISHLVTRPSSGARVTLVCHGVFETNTGLALEGTMTLRTNVAGDGIVQWNMGR